MRIDEERLKPYRKMTDAQRNIRSAGDPEFTQQVLDHYMLGENLNGIELPFSEYKHRFRLKPEELTVLGGINGAGKSLLASQMILHAGEQGYKSLSISMEMSPKAQLARMNRQASLQAEPTLDAIVEFSQWAKEKIYFYDQHGSVDPNTLVSIIRYSADNYGIKLVLVDSLMTMSMASDDWNGQKSVVNALANCARNLGVHVILVAHAKKGEKITDKLDKWSIAGSADITNRADNVILFGRSFNSDPHEPDAHFDLCKARHYDNAEHEINLQLCMASLNYYQRETLPRAIGVPIETKPKGGIMGELDRVALHDPTIGKSERTKTTEVVSPTLN